MKLVHISLLLLFLCAISTHGAEQKPAAELTDTEAKTIIEERWNSASVMVIPIGTISISHGLSTQRDSAKRHFNQEDLQKFKAYQTAGLIQIREQKNYTDKFTGWNDFQKLSQEGVGSEIQISLTPQGKKLNVSTNVSVARIPEGAFQVTKIISNEELQKDFDHYRLVTGLHKAEWTPAMKQVSRFRKKPVPTENRKFRALFVFDKFAANWKLAASDVADLEAEFSSNNVKEALDGHKLK